MYQASTAIPTLQSRNFAPALDQSKLEVKRTDKAFHDWIKELTSKLERTNLEVWREMHLVYMLINLYIEGKHMLRKRHRGFGFDVIPMPDSTMASVREQNKLGFYSRALMSKWVASRTKVECVAGDDTEEAIEAARTAEVILDDLQEDIYSEIFRQRESIGGQICGIYARYFHYDDNADGGYTKEAILNEQSVKLGDDTGQCLDCGYTGLAEEFLAPNSDKGTSIGGSTSMATRESGGGYDVGRDIQRIPGDRSPAAIQSGSGDISTPSTEMPPGAMQGSCPSCGSDTIQIDEVPPTNVVNIAGYQNKKVGKICGKTVPYTRLKHEIATSAEDSPWLRWKERYRIEEIKQMFRGVKIGQFDSQMRDSGLEVEESMQRVVGGYQNTAMLGYWSKDREQYGEVAHWWLTPAMYADYVFPMDTETQSGTIPAGTKAADIFPDGMHFIMVSGCDQPLALENDCHRDHWVTAPYHLRFLAGTGIGINDAVEMQRQFNVVLGLVFTQIRTASLPGWLYDKDTVSPDEVRKLGQPQVSVPMSLRNKPEGTRLEQLVYQMAPGQIPSHIPWYIGQLDANMQTISGVLEFSGGLPGVDNKTATGAQIGASMSQQHNSPEFALKGDADVRSANLILQLAKKHYNEPRFIATRGKFGQAGGQWFSMIDLDEGKIKLQAKKDSWLPNTRLNKQEGIEKVLQLTGGIMGLLQLQDAAPDLLEQIEEAYDVTIQGQTYSANAILVRQRVDQAKQLAPQFEQMAQGMTAAIDPMTGMPVDPMQMLAGEIIQSIQPPIEAEEPGHMISINLLRQWFVTDEGKEASPLLRACVKGMIQAHIQAQIAEAQLQGQAQMAAQLPQMQQQADIESSVADQKTHNEMRRDSARANMQAGQEGMQKRPNPKSQGIREGAMQ